MSHILSEIHVNVPFFMLQGVHLGTVLENRLNPEIGFDADVLDSVPYDTYRKYADMLVRHGISVTFHGPFVDLSPGSSDPEIRAVTRRRFKQVLSLVSLFHPKSVVCHAGFENKRYGYMRDVWLANSLSTWQWLAENLNALGSRLVLENVYEQGPEELAPLFDGLRSMGVGFCLDVGHATVFSDASLKRWLDVLGPDLGQVHLHDNLGDMDAHLAMGRGTIDFSVLFEYLHRHPALRPIVTLEPHVAEDLWPSVSYLEAHWPWPSSRMRMKHGDPEAADC